MSTRKRTSRVRTTYEFIKANRTKFSVEAMCRILAVAPSGYYDWLKQPISKRAQEDARLLRLIRASFIASQGIYGAPRVFLDLREAGESCSKHRVCQATVTLDPLTTVKLTPSRAGFMSAFPASRCRRTPPCASA